MTAQSRTASQRVVVAAPFLPFPADSGGRQRMFHLILGLRREFRVCVVAFGDDGAAAESLRSLGVEVLTVPWRTGLGRAALRALAGGASLYQQKFRSPEMTDKLLAVSDLGDCAAIQFEYSYMASYAQDVLLRSRQRPRFVLDCHNVEYRIADSLRDINRHHGPSGAAYRAYLARELRIRRREERLAWSLMDLILAVSEEEADLIRTACPGASVMVAPNGLVPSASRWTGHARDATRSVVFVGTMDYRPNQDALRWFAQEVLPDLRRRDSAVEFIAVGGPDGAAARLLDGVPATIATGWVADVLPYLAQASAVVVPLRAGGGTRLKVLEALSLGCPVVSTPLGAEGLGLRDRVHAHLVDDPKSFAERTWECLEDPAGAGEMGRRGRHHVEERFNWDTSTLRVLDAYQGL